MMIFKQITPLLRRRLAATFILILAAASLGVESAQARIAARGADTPVRKSVLLVLSYQADLPQMVMSQNAIRAELDGAADLKIDWYYEHLDINRFPDLEYQRQIATFLGEKYRNKSIDLVFVSNDQGLTFWLEHRSVILPDTPVVFYDILPGRFDHYEFPNDVTGLIAKLDHTQYLPWIMSAFPTVTEIVVVQGVSEADHRLNTPMDLLQDGLDGKVKLTDWSALPLVEIKQRAANLPSSSVIFYQLMLEDAAGVKYRPIDALRELTSVSAVPVITQYDQSIGTGAIGGYLYSIEKIATQAAQIGLRILRGESVSAIPIAKDQSNRFIFDHSALQRFDIAISALPPDSIIKNRQYSFLELYRAQVVFVSVSFALLLALTVFLGAATRRLNAARSDLKQINASLESQVHERTITLSQTNRALELEVVERKTAEETARAGEALYHQMFANHSAVMLLIAPDTGEIIEANPAAANFYGYSVEALRQMNINQINTLDPQEIAKLRRDVQDGKINYFSVPHRLASGEVREVEVNSAPVEVNGRVLLYSIIHDITERKQAEAQRVAALDALQESRQAAEDIFEFAPDALLMVDEHGAIARVNKQTQILFRYAREELLGKKIDALIPQRFHSSHPQQVAGFFAETHHRPMGSGLELSAVKSDGSEFPVDILLSPLQLSGKAYVTVAVRDISERKQIDEALRRAHTQVVEQQRALATFDERQRIRRDLHDLVNQSIHSLVLFSETLVVLLDKNNVERARHISGRLLESARQALKDLRLLLYQAQTATLENSADLVQQIEVRLATVERRANIEAQVVCESSLERCPKEWLDHLFGIISEALNNSLKHAQARQVKIVLRGAADRLEVEIADDGVGFNVDKPRAGGLGLQNMRERAAILGGILTLTSSPGAGASVLFQAEIKEGSPNSDKPEKI